VSYEKGSAQKEEIGTQESSRTQGERTNVEGSRTEGAEGVESPKTMLKCPKCGADLSTEKGDLDTCPKCGASLRQGPGGPA